MTSPGAFTLVFFALPLPCLFSPFLLPLEVCPSHFSRLSIYSRLPFSSWYPRVFFSRRFRLPTTCEGDGAAASSSLYESRPRRYFAFGVHCYHPILRRLSLKLEVPYINSNVILCNVLHQYFSSILNKGMEIFIQVSYLIFI